jgi:hypothetical protein
MGPSRKFIVVAAALVLVACNTVLNSAPTAMPTSPGEKSPTRINPPLSISTSGTTPNSNFTYVPGSSQKVCQLSGETDRQFNASTANQTVTRFGLVGTDLGYSFVHDRKLFFLFGDSITSATFNGKPNGPSNPPRQVDDNDAIAFSTDTSLSPCIRLNFITYPDGAFKNPVVLDAQGKPAIKLHNLEVPVAGISESGRMFVFYATDNPEDAAIPPQPLGAPTRTVAAVSDDNANTFHYLYDLSKGSNGRFINIALGVGQDGFLYFWGTQGGTLYRKSSVFLARRPTGSLGSLIGMEYLQSINADGKPVFISNESLAMPLFHDSTLDATGKPQTADCMGELGVEWNPFLKRWVMLYNCSDRTPANPPGIYMRLAENPWGPWSAPQTIFNSERDKGLCYFIHRAVTDKQQQCDTVSDPNRLAEGGGVYGPYFLAGFTTGEAASGTSTFYYTLSTWNPYTQVIMKTTIQAKP